MIASASSQVVTKTFLEITIPFFILHSVGVTVEPFNINKDFFHKRQMTLISWDLLWLFKKIAAFISLGTRQLCVCKDV